MRVVWARSLWRAVLAALLVCGIGLLPWLTRTDPAFTVLKARSAEREATPAVLADIRAQLGLDAGPLRLLGDWLGGLPRGDAGRSWISGSEVMPDVMQALGASLLLMAVALAIAVLVAALVCARTLWGGGRRRGGGSGSAMVAALPEFLTASVLATVVGVQLGWLPALGWYGFQWTILPGLALGLPAGALLGRLLDDLLPGAFAEPWALAAAARGIPARRIASQAVRRCLPALLPNAGLFVVGLTGGSVAIEQIFDIPGLGRTALQAALAQDLPVLQASTLVLVLLAALAAGATRLAARSLIGPALRDGLSSLHRPAPPVRRTPPSPYAGLLLAVVALGLPRDPLASTPGPTPTTSWAHPFGTDALGRDILARLGHGAPRPLLLAVAISAVALLIGLSRSGRCARVRAPSPRPPTPSPPSSPDSLVIAGRGPRPWARPRRREPPSPGPPSPRTPPRCTPRNAPPRTSPPPVALGADRPTPAAPPPPARRPAARRPPRPPAPARRSPSPSPPSASSASARSRPHPEGGRMLLARTCPTPNAPPGPSSPPPPSSPSSARCGADPAVRTSAAVRSRAPIHGQAERSRHRARTRSRGRPTSGS